MAPFRRVSTFAKGTCSFAQFWLWDLSFAICHTYFTTSIDGAHNSTFYAIQDSSLFLLNFRTVYYRPGLSRSRSRSTYMCVQTLFYVLFYYRFLLASEHNGCALYDWPMVTNVYVMCGSHIFFRVSHGKRDASVVHLFLQFLHVCRCVYVWIILHFFFGCAIWNQQRSSRSSNRAAETLLCVAWYVYVYLKTCNQWSLLLLYWFIRNDTKHCSLGKRIACLLHNHNRYYLFWFGFVDILYSVVPVVNRRSEKKECCCNFIPPIFLHSCRNLKHVWEFILYVIFLIRHSI